MGTMEVIRHRGVVLQVGENSVSVRILQATACSSCSAKQLCRSSESKEKVVEVGGSYPTLRPGDEVVLSGTVHQGLRASLLAYALPLVLMVAVLFAGTQWKGEGFGALAAVLSLALYYAILFLMRGKIARRFTFAITRETE